MEPTLWRHRRRLPRSSRAPGSRRMRPSSQRARRAGLEVIGELELGWRLVPNEFIAVTGTNGKTTTVELIGAMHRAAGVPVAVAGNVGTPGELPGRRGSTRPPRSCARRRASSSRTPIAFAPEVAVLLNFAADHLDRHGTLANYRDAKLRIFANQEPSGRRSREPADIDMPPLRRAHGAVRATCGRRHQPTCGCAAPQPAEREGRGRGVPWSAASTRARSAARCATSAASRTASRHVAEIGGVDVRQRLEGHEPERGRRARCSSFDAGVHAILGGSLKGGGFAELAPAVAARCRACYLIGEAAEQLAEDLAGTGVELVRVRRPRARRARGLAARAAGRGGAARSGLRELRPVPRLRGARRALQGAGARARRRRDEAATAPAAARGTAARASR